MNGNETNFHFSDAFWITMHLNVSSLNNVTENITENATNNLQIIILHQILNRAKVTVDQLAALFKDTRFTIFRDIEKQKEESKLLYKGPAKGGHWEVMEKYKITNSTI